MIRLLMAYLLKKYTTCNTTIMNVKKNLHEHESRSITVIRPFLKHVVFTNRVTDNYQINYILQLVRAIIKLA